MAQQAPPLAIQQPPPRPPRLLALDYGAKRTGVAITDELGMFAHPRAAIVGASAAALINEVAAVVERDGIDEVIVGLPLTLAGDESRQTREVRDFAAKLRSRLAIPVREWDERLSTTSAARQIKGAASRRSGALDSAAAAVVLQAVIDARRRPGSP